MSLKTAYLHGLESNNIGAKNEWLRTFSDVYDPLINYWQKNIYLDIKNTLVKYNPDLIIGSSMGGFFAYNLAQELNIPAVLFNPAIHSRSFTPDLNGLEKCNFKPPIHFVFGEADDLIDPKTSIEIIAKNGYTKNNYIVLPHGHRTPYEVFVREISEFVSNYI